MRLNDYEAICAEAWLVPAPGRNHQRRGGVGVRIDAQALVLVTAHARMAYS